MNTVIYNVVHVQNRGRILHEPYDIVYLKSDVDQKLLRKLPNDRAIILDYLHMSTATIPQMAQYLSSNQPSPTLNRTDMIITLILRKDRDNTIGIVIEGPRLNFQLKQLGARNKKMLRNLIRDKIYQTADKL
jgi:hypothetical protein